MHLSVFLGPGATLGDDFVHFMYSSRSTFRIRIVVLFLFYFIFSCQ